MRLVKLRDEHNQHIWVNLHNVQYIRQTADDLEVILSSKLKDKLQKDTVTHKLLITEIAIIGGIVARVFETPEEIEALFRGCGCR